MGVTSVAGTIYLPGALEITPSIFCGVCVVQSLIWLFAQDTVFHVGGVYVPFFSFCL